MGCSSLVDRWFHYCVVIHKVNKLLTQNLLKNLKIFLYLDTSKKTGIINIQANLFNKSANQHNEEETEK